jgi:hypothetical protein
MPMIDVYAGAAVFDDKKELARRLAAAVMAVEEVPDIPIFRQNTATFVHEFPSIDGGWGLREHAHTNTELVKAARSQLAQTAETSTAADA